MGGSRPAITRPTIHPFTNTAAAAPLLCMTLVLGMNELDTQVIA